MIKVKGAEKLQRKLDQLSKKGAKRAMRKATRAGTTVLAKAVKGAVPVDEGLLKKAQAQKITSRGMAMAGIVGADVSKLEADNQADASRPTNIDHLVEHGHVAPDGTFVPPSGYMRRAAASAMPAAEKRYTDKLAEEIEKEALK